MNCRLMNVGCLSLVLVFALAIVAPAAIITDVVRMNGQDGDRDPIGVFDGGTAPMATEEGGLIDGNMVFSDRTYPWAGVPSEMAGSEYVRTFNTDKNGGETDVMYNVTISREAIVWVTVDDRIPAEWDGGGAILSQQDAVDRITMMIAGPGTFTDTGLDLFVREKEDGSTDRPMSVFSAQLDAGTYTFFSLDSGKNYYTIGAMLVPSSDPFSPGARGLLASFDFELDANDVSGNGNNGTLLGDAHVLDGVLVLDGDDDAVGLARIGGEEAVFGQTTYSMWVYPTVDQTAIDFSGGINTNVWGAGAVHCKIRNGMVNVGISGAGEDLQGTTIVDPNTWSLITMTVTDKAISLYLNGLLEDTRALEAPLENLILGDATIGAWNNNGTEIQREMTGFMDDVRIYDRGLSEAEVQWLAGFRPTPVDPGTEGLKVAYSLDNDANDSSGNGFDGTLIGDPNYVEGIAGMAMEFDGDDYVDTGYTEDLAVWTIACWAKSPEEPNAAGSPAGPLHREKNYQINWDHSQDSFRAAVGLAVANGWFGASFGDLEADTWYFLVGTYDGEDLKAYKNGELISINSDPSGPTTPETNSLKLGKHAASEQFFTGSVDEAKVYDRVLSGAEIMYLAGIRADITSAKDVVQGVPNDGDWPNAETPDLAVDNDAGTKFLHFKGETETSGIQITPAGGMSVVTALTLTAANDAPERDPIAFELYGSNESIDGPYTLIASGDVVDFAQEVEWPRFTMNETEISFDNDVAYAHYQLLFTAVRDAGSANSMQIAEVELIGALVQ